MVGFRWKCPFRQYLPSKPDKYGMKLFWVCDSTYGYPLGVIPYTGKNGNVRAAPGSGSTVLVKSLFTPHKNTNFNKYLHIA